MAISRPEKRGEKLTLSGLAGMIFTDHILSDQTSDAVV